MKQFKYIGSISKDELSNNFVIPCINEEGYRCVLVKNQLEKIVTTKYETDNLEVKMNAVLHVEGEPYYYHILTAKKNDVNSIADFELVYEYIFMKIKNAIDDTMLAKLILSLEEYFRITPQRDSRQLQIGVWGELFCIKNLYSNGYKEIISKYHNNFYLKHDIEINDTLRIEIKTTAGSKRIHHFRHDQICRDDVTVLVASLMVEEAQEGTSLLALSEQIIDLFDDPDDKLNLKKIIKMCGLSEDNSGIIISETKAARDMLFFEAKSLPMITETIPNGVTKVEYDVDCSFGEVIDMNDYLFMLKEKVDD